MTLRQATMAFQRGFIAQALLNSSSASAAARRLGISRQTLYEHCYRVGLMPSPRYYNAKRRRRAAGIVATLTVGVLMVAPAAALDCHLYQGQGSIQDAVNTYECVRLSQGTHFTLDQILLPPGHYLVGAGRDKTLLKADPLVFPMDGRAVVTAGWNEPAAHRVIADMTIDGAGVAVQVAGYFDLRLLRVRIMGGLCNGVTIARGGVIIADAIIEHNSHPTWVEGRGYLTCEANPLGGLLYGAGVYLNRGDHRPKIVRTTIQDNYGPGIDSWGGRGLYLAHSTVRGNIGWAAVHLYDGATDAVIADSVIEQTDASYLPWMQPECYPEGFGSAAIRACRDSGGLIVVRSELIGEFSVLAAVNSPVSYLEANGYHGRAVEAP